MTHTTVVYKHTYKVIVQKANISTLDQTLTLHMHTQISHTIAQEIPVQL